MSIELLEFPRTARSMLSVPLSADAGRHRYVTAELYDRGYQIVGVAGSWWAFIPVSLQFVRTS